MRGETTHNVFLIFTTQIRCLRSLILPKREVNAATPWGGHHLNFSNNDLEPKPIKSSCKKDIFGTLDITEHIVVCPRTARGEVLPASMA